MHAHAKGHRAFSVSIVPARMWYGEREGTHDGSDGSVVFLASRGDGASEHTTSFSARGTSLRAIPAYWDTLWRVRSSLTHQKSPSALGSRCHLQAFRPAATKLRLHQNSNRSTEVRCLDAIPILSYHTPSPSVLLAKAYSTS